jgi:hypothetical protein
VPLAQGLPRAARGAPERRPGAAHAVAGRPAAPGAAEEQPRAGQQAWAQPGAAARHAGVARAEGRGVVQEVPQARDAAAGLAARDAARQPVVRHVAAVRLSAVVSVFRRDRVRLEPVQRRSERFARATAC